LGFKTSMTSAGNNALSAQGERFAWMAVGISGGYGGIPVESLAN
jgi:hypothetical protein